MKIEIAKQGRMDMSGKGLIRAIQNNNMPLLDLLVRESVQNSLDAFRKESEFVQVDFGINEFYNSQLASELNGITSTLIDNYDEKCKLLFIRDTGTEGLTGPLHFTDGDTAEKKNLLKLVYEIAKPQEGKGAGGSWGYGKTVYFRIGIGLVIYYSRIKQKNGEYQSRLAACLVEDENRSDALLKSAELNSHRGLAWWGHDYKFESNGIMESGTIPETDDAYINQFLEIFGVKPFVEDQTGTTIIIPYIDEKKLLSNNIVSDGVNLPWGSSVEEYLKIAVQRWYIGRLNNEDYHIKQKQPWLRVTINGDGLACDDMAKPFSEIQKLYNMALMGAESTGEYFCEPVKIRNVFSNTTAGYIAYKMYTAEEMEMNPPFNNPSPFLFVKNEEGADDYKDGDIILSYFRKPGMVVNYDTAGEWVNKIKCNNEKSGDTLIAVFVLNSSNKFKAPITEFDTIEEYFRASERADHTAWYDINVNDTNPKILSKIQQGVRKKINDTYKIKEKEEEKESSSLSKLFGEFFLPPEGFGKKAKGKMGGRKAPSGEIKHKNVRVLVDKKRIVVKGNKMVMPINMEAAMPFSDVAFSFLVAADGKNIPLESWYSKTEVEVPFCIENVKINVLQAEKKILETHIELNSETQELRRKDCTIRLLRAPEGCSYGINVTSELKELLISAEIVLSVNDVMAQLKYQLKGGE